jgi:sensor histidine kinase YesM
MTTTTFIEGTRTSSSSRQTARRFWLQHAGYGLLLGVSIALLEFAYYYPLVSTPDKLGVMSLLSSFLTWCGEGTLLALTVALFERWKAPTPLSARQLALAVTIGSVAGVLVWQAFVQFILRERFGIWLFRDHVGQSVNWAGTVLYHVWLMLVFGGLGAAVRSSRQRHARMLAMLRAAELNREILQQGLADARLAALQARIDPEYLFQTLTKLEQLYEADPSAADRLIEELIAFLRGALADIQVSRASATSDRTPAREEAFQVE